ncbi:MAG TPA: 4-alpha-glucanotransferase [Acidimicrobiales bacterium]
MTSPDDLRAELLAHATALGVETGYWDVQGHHHEASIDALVAVLSAMGAPIDGLADAPGSLRAHVLHHQTVTVPAVVVVVGDAPLSFELCLPAADDAGRVHVELDAEDGGTRSWDIDLAAIPVVGERHDDGRHWRWRRLDLGRPDVGIGAHAVTVEVGGLRHPMTALVAPDHVVQPGDRERWWGAFAPLYSLRTERGRGPDVFDLDILGGWIDRHGGRIVGTLPLLATFLDRPFDPSPYSPVSRCYWNEAYLDVERLPELAGCPTAMALLDDPATQVEVASLRTSSRYDAAASSRLVTAVLDELTRTFFAQPVARRADFDAWVDGHPGVVEYGRFRAAVERTGMGWHGWSEGPRAGRLAADDYDRRVAARHVYAQWSMHHQLSQVQAGLTARGQRLYLDLPVGASGEGFDTWVDQSAYGWGAAVGAPPDDFFALGQNWGFPPMRPEQARADGHRHLAECLRHHMTHAGMLRLDHVMGLHRLFWVPDGMEATEGVYVRYPTEEQFAVVAIESHRADCLVVGEDLGTVPDAVREAMDRHRVLRSYVAEFAMPEGPDGALGMPDRRTVATVDTHDTPPFAAFLAAEDIRARVAAGHLPHEDAAHEFAHRQRQCDALVADLERRGYEAERDGDARDVLRGVLQALGASDAPAVLVALDDLVGTIEAQNVPGTGPDRPNWVHRLPRSLTEMAADAGIEATLAALQARRLGSHARAQATAASTTADGRGTAV